jgi:hypothetical protein
MLLSKMDHSDEQQFLQEHPLEVMKQSNFEMEASDTEAKAYKKLL